MEEKYTTAIKKSVDETMMYTFEVPDGVPMRHLETHVLFEEKDSVSAIFENRKGKAAVLNFASYKNPGGMFINGSKAQEECLCHESFLYNVLRQFPDYYDWNNKHKNRALYENRALYTPNVIFERDNEAVVCDVITCAAPNFTAAEGYCHVSKEENLKVLEDRIDFVLGVAQNNHVDTLILGAYGCGVFGQKASEVAKIFYDLLSTKYLCFEKVVFAIPEDKTENYEHFKKTFTQLYIQSYETPKEEETER